MFLIYSLIIYQEQPEEQCVNASDEFYTSSSGVLSTHTPEPGRRLACRNLHSPKLKNLLDEVH